MTDLNPAIWKNKTLGAAAPNVSLEELELQKTEDRNARYEGREPRIAVREVNYPVMTPSGSVPSSVSNVIKLVDASEIVNPSSEEEDLFSPVTFDDDPLKEQ